MYDGDTPPTPQPPPPDPCPDCRPFPGWREMARHFRRPWPDTAREWWRIYNQPARGPRAPEVEVILAACTCALGATRPGPSFEIVSERWAAMPGHRRTFVSSASEPTLTPAHRETVAQFATRTRGYPEPVRVPTADHGRIWGALLDDFRLEDP